MAVRTKTSIIDGTALLFINLLLSRWKPLAGFLYKIASSFTIFTDGKRPTVP
jgi:hypothetical protein